MRYLVIPFICFICLPLYSQELSSFEKLLELERARRFPFCGKLNLSQNHPYPFSSKEASVINYKAIDATRAEIVIYDDRGSIISIHTIAPGVGEFYITPGQLAPGKYAYALIVNNRRIFKRKLVVMSET